MTLKLKRGECPYFKWRNGRPRWEPNGQLTRDGWRGVDLKDYTGNWLALEAAVAAAQEKNKELAAWRASGGQLPLPGRRSPRRDYVLHLWIQFEASRYFQKNARSTQRDYRNKIRFFLEWCGDMPVSVLTTPLILDFWEVQVDRRGLAMANGIVAVARAFFSWCRRRGHITINPAQGLGLERPDARVVIWLPEEVSALVALADAAGEFGVGDAIVAALHTGQRQADVLSLPERIFAGDRVALTQAKTGALVDVPMTDALKVRVAAARGRAGARGVLPRTFIIDDRSGETFNLHTFRHRFAELRAAVAGLTIASGKPIAAKWPDAAARALKAPMPGVSGKLFLDFRDTAVTRLYLAGCSLLMIAAITGHSPKSIASILKHYVALDAGDATSAIASLQEWMKREGVEI